MAEPSRSDVPPINPQYPQGAEHEEFSSAQGSYERQAIGSDLPPGDIYGQLPRSRAESFGRTVGTAVGGVLRFPQRVGQATSRVRHAGSSTRAQASAAVLDMMDTAAQRAEHLRRSAGDAVSGWARSTRYQTERLEERAIERWEQLRSAAKERLELATERASDRWSHTQRAVNRMREEDPARFLMVVAGAAFVIGAGLRIWRASND